MSVVRKQVYPKRRHISARLRGVTRSDVLEVLCVCVYLYIYIYIYIYI